MKTIIQQLSRNLATKANIDYEANTFAELKQLLTDVAPIFKFSDEEKVGGPYYGIEEMRSGYFESCFTPELRVTSSHQTMERLCNFIDITNQAHCFSNIDYSELYDELADAPDGIVILEITTYNKLCDLFEQLRQFSEQERCRLEVSLANIFPDDQECAIEYVVECGKISGGGTIELLEDNSNWYLMRLYWMCYAFDEMSQEDLDAMNVSITITRPEEDTEFELHQCGMLIGLNYKYGKTPDIFDTEEQTIALIKQYPILVDFLPEKWQQSKSVALAFIESNNAFVKKYYDAIEESEKDGVYCALSCVRKIVAEAFFNGLPKHSPSFSQFYDDTDVLTALANSLMSDNIYFEKDNYHEQTIAVSIANAPRLAIPLLDYWKEKISNHPKTIVHLKIKYELRDDVSLEELAVYKCLEVIESSQGNTVEAKGILFAHANNKYLQTMHEEHKKEIAKVYRTLDVDLQNYLADEFYSLISFMRADDVNPALAECVAQTCPIAALLLPDEYILKHNLEEPDEDPCDICDKCGKCHMGNIIIV